MGSTPTQQIKADLNGTGTLVDISSYVDFDKGINALVGRTDWTAATPRPGSLTFDLDNRDGRFTPGNTATYTVGMVNGCEVEWTVGDTTGGTIADLFERADADLFGSTADDANVSKVWGEIAASGSHTWSIVSGAAGVTAGTASNGIAYLGTGYANYTVTATLAAVHGTTGSRSCGLVFRLTDTDNHWRVRASTSSAVWLIERVVSGAVTVVYTSAVAPTAGDVVSAAVSGTALNVTVNGTPLTSTITMAHHLGSAYVGFLGMGASSDTTSKWSDIEITGVPYTRVRTYRAGTPELSFGGGVAGQTTVTVPCLDAIGDLAKHQMRQMVDEVAFGVRPAAYWPLNDSGAGVQPQGADISGHAESALIAHGNYELLSWANGVGPRTDGRAALSVNPSATSGPATTDVWLEPAAALGVAGATHEWETTDTSLATPASAAGMSVWFAVRDIYGATSTTANDYDGPYVFIARLGWAHIMWRIPDRRIVIAWPDYAGVNPLTFPTSPALAVGATHHVAIVATENPTTSGVGVWIDGVYYDMMTTSDVTAPSLAPPEISLAGGLSVSPTVAGSDPTVYGLSGTIACCSVYDADATTVALTFPDFTVLDPTEFYAVGMTGPQETSDLRFTRLGSFMQRSDLAFVAKGTPQTTLIDMQDTGRQSMLAAMCDALRLDDANLDCRTIAGVNTVRAWLRSENRAAVPAVSIDVDADGQGVPVLSYDSSGVATTVTVRGFSSTVTWLDSDAPERWQGTSATLTCATDSVDDLRALAQYRALLGRTDVLVPTKVTVDAVTSSADLTTTLLELRPLQRVELTGLPSSVIGYSETDVIVTGITERHSLGRSLVELTLMPDLDLLRTVEGEARVGSLSEFTFDGVRYYPQIWGDISGIGIDASQTTIYYADLNGSDFLGTDSAIYPMALTIDSEDFTITAAAAPVVSSLTTQAFTVTRGVNGTTAASHTGLQVGPQPWVLPEMLDYVTMF